MEEKPWENSEKLL